MEENIWRWMCFVYFVFMRCIRAKQFFSSNCLLVASRLATDSSLCIRRSWGLTPPKTGNNSIFNSRQQVTSCVCELEKRARDTHSINTYICEISILFIAKVSSFWEIISSIQLLEFNCHIHSSNNSYHQMLRCTRINKTHRLLQLNLIFFGLIKEPAWMRQTKESTSSSSLAQQFSPITSASSFWARKNESSPNLPNLYLVLSRSFGKPQTTETRCGLDLLCASASVEKRMALRISLAVVQHIDCMSSGD